MPSPEDPLNERVARLEERSVNAEKALELARKSVEGAASKSFVSMNLIISLLGLLTGLSGLMLAFFKK